MLMNIQFHYRQYCPTCNLKVERPSRAEHMARHGLMCRTCGATMSDLEALKLHTSKYATLSLSSKKGTVIKDANRKETYYTCLKCGEQFDSFRLLTEHQGTHKDIEFICDTCKKVFRSKNRLSIHYLRKYKPGSCSIYSKRNQARAAKEKVKPGKSKEKSGKSKVKSGKSKENPGKSKEKAGKTKAQQNKADVQSAKTKDQLAKEKEQTTIEKEQVIIEKEQPTIEKEQPTLEKEQVIIEKEQAIIEKERAILEKEHSDTDAGSGSEKGLQVTERGESDTENVKTEVEKAQIHIEKEETVTEKGQDHTEKRKNHTEKGLNKEQKKMLLIKCSQCHKKYNSQRLIDLHMQFKHKVKVNISTKQSSKKAPTKPKRKLKPENVTPTEDITNVATEPIVKKKMSNMAEWCTGRSNSRFL